MLINVLAHELERAARDRAADARRRCFSAVRRGAPARQRLVRGGRADRRPRPAGVPRSVRHPAAVRSAQASAGRPEVMVASEIGRARRHRPHADARRGARRGGLHRPRRPRCTRASAPKRRALNPCMFEYVYLARPDSVMDGVSVYQARLNMGETLAQRVISTMPPSEIDVVIPIPESSRPSAMQLAQKIGKPYREGFVKNRYVGRTFIMPGQARAQEVGAPEAQRDRQSSSRAATCCWSTTRSCAARPAKRDRADGARGRRAQGLHGLGRAAGALSRTSTASTCRPRTS